MASLSVTAADVGFCDQIVISFQLQTPVIIIAVLLWMIETACELLRMFQSQLSRRSFFILEGLLSFCWFTSILNVSRFCFPQNTYKIISFKMYQYN